MGGWVDGWIGFTTVMMLCCFIVIGLSFEYGWGWRGERGGEGK